MNQIVYYRKLIPYLILMILYPLEAKLVKPSKNGEEKEVLIISGKRRLYYPVRSEGLHYSIQGPTRLEFISRYPVLRGKKKSHPFQYRIIIDGIDTVIVNHRYKVQKSIRSIQHPKHKYTFSGNYFINLDKGSHSIEIISNNEQKYPVLLRAITKEFESIGKNKKILTPMVHKTALHIRSNGKKINYFDVIRPFLYKLKLEVKKHYVS